MAGATDPRFAEVERQYYALKGQLSSGALTRDQFEAALQTLMLLDSQSRYWMMGAESGKWYVYDGQNWQQADPPAPRPPEPSPAAPVLPAAAAASQSESATLASFTTPAATARPDSETLTAFAPPASGAATSAAVGPATEPVTPDTAPTMSFDAKLAAASAAAVEPVTPDAAPTVSFDAKLAAAPATSDEPSALSVDSPAAGATPTTGATSPAANTVTPDNALTQTFAPPVVPASARQASSLPQRGADVSETSASARQASNLPQRGADVSETSASTAATQSFPTASVAGAPRDSAPTMASFVPPTTSKIPPDKAATVAAFTLPRIPPAAAASAVRPVPAAATDRTLSPVLVFGCLFVLVCLGGLIALAFAVNSRLGSAPEPTLPPVAVAAVSAAATTIPANTNVPAGAATSNPTVAPTTARNTQQPAPTTRPPVVIPVTVTSSATPVPDTPTPLPTDTDTPAPVRPRPPADEFANSFAYIGYEQWGAPYNDCTQYNNLDARRQFKWEEVVTNKSPSTITDSDWGVPSVTNNEGSPAVVCGYGAPMIPPGQSGKVTYAAYVKPNQFVQRIQHQIRNTVYLRCLDAGAHEVAC